MTDPVLQADAADSAAPAAFSPDITMHTLLTGIYATQGGIAMAHVIAGYLTGIQTAIASRVGPEAAYATLQRHADAAALELSAREG